MSLIVAALLLMQDQAGTDLVKKAVTTTQSQKSFETTFKARYSPPKGATLDYQGRQVWVAPGVLYMAFTGSAGLDKKIVRAGGEVWTYHELNGWDVAAANGDDGAARGMQHPVEILEILGAQSKSAMETKTGASITLSGDALRAALKHHVQENAVAWAKSTARVDLTVDAEGRLKSLACNATLIPNAPGPPIGYSMDVSLVGYNGATDLKFKDSKDRPLPLTPNIQERISEVLAGRKP